MKLDTLDEVDELIEKVENYRHTLKWASRDPNDPQWDNISKERTVALIKECKAKLGTEKNELISYLKTLVMIK